MMNSQVIPISLMGTKAFIIKGKKNILIDTGTPGSSKKIIDAMKKENLAPTDIALIVITHSHTDHFGSAKTLKKETKAPIAAHKLEVEALENGRNIFLNPTCFQGKFFKLLLKEEEKDKGIKIDIIIEDELDLKEYGIAGKIIHTPGHTPGSLSIILETGEAIISDMVMGGFFRNPQNPAYPHFESDRNQLKKSIKKLMSYNPTIIHAAHGGPFTPQAIQEKFKESL